MSNITRISFLIHTFVSLIFGIPLLLVPGGFLDIFGWAPVDPLISRLLGAALIGMAWTSLRGWRASDWSEVGIIVEGEAIFCVLGCIGLARHLFFAWYPFMVWFVFALMLIFAIVWIIAWIRKE
jgi:hypothetical protein